MHAPDNKFGAFGAFGVMALVEGLEELKNLEKLNLASQLRMFAGPLLLNAIGGTCARLNTIGIN